MSKKLSLKSSDGKIFVVEESVALQSRTIRYMVGDKCAENEIPMPNVTGDILSKVIEYCMKHDEATKQFEGYRAADEELKKWDSDFVKVDQATLFNLVLASNYLDIKSLMDLTCRAVADMITGKGLEDIRKTFNIVNDYSPEEEQELRRQNKWAFDH